MFLLGHVQVHRYTVPELSSGLCICAYLTVIRTRTESGTGPKWLNKVLENDTPTGQPKTVTLLVIIETAYHVVTTFGYSSGIRLPTLSSDSSLLISHM